MRESLAVTMGHSVRKAREVYDRRTIQQKKRPAVQYKAKLVRQKLGIDSTATEKDTEPHILPAVGNVVAVVSITDDDRRDFMLGKVLSIGAEGTQEAGDWRIASRTVEER